MRIVAVCEKCGARTEVHRLGVRVDVRLEHMCDSADNKPIHPDYEKGPIHSVDLAGGRPDPCPVF